MKRHRSQLGIVIGFLCGILVLAVSSSVLAASITEPLTLEDCLSRIQSQSVQFAQSVVAEKKAKAALKSAMNPRLPQLVAQENLMVAMNPDVLAPDSNKAVVRAELGTLPFLGSAWKLGDEKSLELQAAKIDIIQSKQDVGLLVKELYFSVLRDEQIIKSLDRVEGEFKKLLATVTPKFQIGHAPQFDVVKVKSSEYDLARLRDMTRSQWIGEKSELNQILHLGGTDFALERLRKIPPLESTRVGFMDNPTLAGLQQDIEVANVGISVAKAQRLPSLSAAFEYGYEGLTPTTMVNQWVAIGQLRFSIFDWGLISSQVDQAQASAQLAQKKLEAQTEKTRSEYDRTYALAQANLADQQRLKSLLPSLKRAANAAVQRYRVGGMGILETTDAINLWLQGLINERTAYYNYLSDLAKLERITGHSTVTYE